MHKKQGINPEIASFLAMFSLRCLQVDLCGQLPTWILLVHPPLNFLTLITRLAVQAAAETVSGGVAAVQAASSLLTGQAQAVTLTKRCIKADGERSEVTLALVSSPPPWRSLWTRTGTAAHPYIGREHYLGSPVGLLTHPPLKRIIAM